MAENSIKKDEEVIRRSKFEIIKRLLVYLKPYKLKAFIVVLLMLIPLKKGLK